ncbi:hypothetical protein [Halovibrio sp. HP20-50]|uniref:hypothetical protein n=1 Tax=Halovibrio sp. HP20-59 TaxID=3080275 RepID=UPI00294B6591|nr:hypothetical protein [Halovibrio sp. HP20-59]MEA2117273.1 hypothetical protein [Halovibrio sp. HP20-59]
MTAPRLFLSVVFNVLVDEAVILFLEAIPSVSADFDTMAYKDIFDIIYAQPQRIVSETDMPVFFVVDYLIHPVKLIDIRYCVVDVLTLMALDF